MPVKRRSLALGAGLVALLLPALLGAGAPQSRFERLGQQLICTCGCTQAALVCNHVGCPVVTQMRAEIQQRAQSSDSDALILQSFVQEYGTQVLANPTTQGFNLLAWIMPWVALALGLGLVLWYVRRWRHRQAAPAGAGNEGLQTLIHEEIQAEIDREWKG